MRLPLSGWCLLAAACEPVGVAATADPAPRSPALAALAALPVRERAPHDGYDRDEFGPRWADIDHNGCDQRNDVLARDLVDEEFAPGTHDCVVTAGTLYDPYTGAVVRFVRGETTSDDVQIDHVVSLANAWETGAQHLDGEARKALANDPLNLLAVDGATNQSKGDRDAAEWLPPNGAVRCAFAARQVAVKARYGLWVTEAERAALASALGTCDREPDPDGARGLR